MMGEEDVIADLVTITRLGIVTILLWLGSRGGDIWQAGRHPPERLDEHLRLFDSHSVPSRPAPTVTEIRQATKLFRRVTATPDGWHPRQLGNLSAAALRRLSSVYQHWNRRAAPRATWRHLW